MLVVTEWGHWVWRAEVLTGLWCNFWVWWALIQVLEQPGWMWQRHLIRWHWLLQKPGLRGRRQNRAMSSGHQPFETPSYSMPVSQYRQTLVERVAGSGRMVCSSATPRTTLPTSLYNTSGRIGLETHTTSHAAHAAHATHSATWHLPLLLG